ncbi:MAG: DNA-binding response regulator [Chitinophagaceae bacterium]|nr:DNA-binding response regulator [Chitinophagaceae bacterium]
MGNTSAINSSKINIGLVDDHSLIRGAVAILFSTQPGKKQRAKEYVVTLEAENGKDLIKKLKSSNLPDIILLDIHMPEMDGFQTMDWLKKHNPDIKVIILSITDSIASVITMLQKGANGYLTKNSPPESIINAIDAVIAGGYYFSGGINDHLMDILAKQNVIRNHNIQLSEREKNFLLYACTEKTYKEIADEMAVSLRTIDNYRDELYRKLGVSSRTGLVMYAIKHGLIRL